MAQNSENIEARLSAYIDGELTEAERAEIERQLAANADQRRLLPMLDDLRRMRQVLGELPREAAPPELAEALQASLERSALLNEEAAEAEGVIGRIGRWPQALSAAAIILLAVGLGAVVYFVLPSGRPRAAMRMQPSEVAQAPTVAMPEEDKLSMLERRAQTPPEPTLPFAPATTAPSPVLARAPEATPTEGLAKAGSASLPLKDSYENRDIAHNAQALDSLKPQGDQKKYGVEQVGQQVVLRVSTDDVAASGREVIAYLESNSIGWSAEDGRFARNKELARSDVAHQVPDAYGKREGEFDRGGFGGGGAGGSGLKGDAELLPTPPARPGGADQVGSTVTGPPASAPAGMAAMAPREREAHGMGQAAGPTTGEARAADGPGEYSRGIRLHEESPQAEAKDAEGQKQKENQTAVIRARGMRASQVAELASNLRQQPGQRLRIGARDEGAALAPQEGNDPPASATPSATRPAGGIDDAPATAPATLPAIAKDRREAPDVSTFENPLAPATRPARSVALEPGKFEYELPALAGAPAAAATQPATQPSTQATTQPAAQAEKSAGEEATVECVIVLERSADAAAPASLKPPATTQPTNAAEKAAPGTAAEEAGK